MRELKVSSLVGPVAGLPAMVAGAGRAPLLWLRPSCRQTTSQNCMCPHSNSLVISLSNVVTCQEANQVDATVSMCTQLHGRRDSNTTCCAGKSRCLSSRNHTWTARHRAAQQSWQRPPRRPLRAADWRCIARSAAAAAAIITAAAAGKLRSCPRTATGRHAAAEVQLPARAAAAAAAAVSALPCAACHSTAAQWRGLPNERLNPSWYRAQRRGLCCGRAGSRVEVLLRVQPGLEMAACRPYPATTLPGEESPNPVAPNTLPGEGEGNTLLPKSAHATNPQPFGRPSEHIHASLQSRFTCWRI